MLQVLFCCFVSSPERTSSCRSDESKRRSVDSLHASRSLRLSVQTFDEDTDSAFSPQPTLSITAMSDPDDRCSPHCSTGLQSCYDSSDLNRTDSSSCRSDQSPKYQGVTTHLSTGSRGQETVADAQLTRDCENSKNHRHCSVDSLLSELEHLTERSTVTVENVNISPIKQHTTNEQHDSPLKQHTTIKQNTSPLKQHTLIHCSPSIVCTSNRLNPEQIADKSTAKCDASGDRSPERDGGQGGKLSTKVDKLVEDCDTSSSLSLSSSAAAAAAAACDNESSSDLGSSVDTKSNDDLSIDIDTALAEVMSGIQLLQRDKRSSFLQQKSQSQSASPLVFHDMKSPSLVLSVMRDIKQPTPDLVVGLPYGSRQHSFSPGLRSRTVEPHMEKATSPTSNMTTAEMFANIDSCTIRKVTSASAPASAEIILSSENPLRNAATSDVTSRVEADAVSNKTNQLASCVQSRSANDWLLDSTNSIDPSNIQVRPLSSRATSAERRLEQTWSVFVPSTTSFDHEDIELAAKQKLSELTPISHRVQRYVSESQSSRTSEQFRSFKPEVGPSSSFLATLPRTAAVPDKPRDFKPPVKAKPQLMKKPVMGQDGNAETERRVE